MKPPPPVNINLVEPSLPLTITVLPRTVGTLSLATPNPTLKAGNEVSVVVKVARRYDFAGEFKVSLVPPANVKDVSAAEVVIPAGKDEATLVLKAPPRAPRRPQRPRRPRRGGGRRQHAHDPGSEVQS